MDKKQKIKFHSYSACVCRTSENCKSLILQDKYNIDFFFVPC